MLTLFLGIALMIALFGWGKNRLSFMVCVRYMDMQNCKLPSDDEIRACTEWVIKHALHRE